MPMSMRIESTAGVAASANQTTTSQTSATPAMSVKTSPSITPVIDPTTGEPELPKFPWLSHLTVQLQQDALNAKAAPIEVGPFKQADRAGTQLDERA